jgi:hypothetical protein
MTEAYKERSHESKRRGYQHSLIRLILDDANQHLAVHRLQPRWGIRDGNNLESDALFTFETSQHALKIPGPLSSVGKAYATPCRFIAEPCP